jgi:hypothetical protein
MTDDDITRLLDGYVVPDPPPALTAGVLRVAAPLLAQHARPSWRALARALVVALVPLPAILALDVVMVRGAYDLLHLLLPAALSAYVAFNYAALLALLLGLTYAAVPVLAARQARLQLQEAHG